MRRRLLGRVRLPFERSRAVGVGMALVGVVGLGLVAVPACGGGGATGDNAVHLAGAGTALALGVASPNCGGGGSTGDDVVHLDGFGVARIVLAAQGGGGVGDNAVGGGGGHETRAPVGV